jgi:hypothetical protein
MNKFVAVGIIMTMLAVIVGTFQNNINHTSAQEQPTPQQRWPLGEEMLQLLGLYLCPKP